MEKRVLKHLVRSLDSALRKKDRKRLDRALAESADLRRQKAEILSLRQAIAEESARSFRPGFEDRVMNRIRSAPAVPNGIEAMIQSYRWVFGRLAAVSVFVLIVLITVILVQDGLIPKEAVFYVSDTTISRILQVPVF
jgi:anti-sigma factor RsiW